MIVACLLMICAPCLPAADLCALKGQPAHSPGQRPGFYRVQSGTPCKGKSVNYMPVYERFWAYSPYCRCHITQGVIPLRSILPWAEAQVALSGRKLPWAEAQVALYSQSSSASSQGASCPGLKRRLPFIRKAHQQAVRAQVALG